MLTVEPDGKVNMIRTNFSNHMGYGILDAVRRGRTAVVREFLDHGNRFSGTKLVMAAAKGKWDLVRFLLERGIDINSGVTPIIASAVTWEREDLVREYVGIGASIHGEFGAKAVKTAKKEGLESMPNLLQELGISVENAVETNEELAF